MEKWKLPLRCPAAKLPQLFNHIHITCASLPRAFQGNALRSTAFITEDICPAQCSVYQYLCLWTSTSQTFPALLPPEVFLFLMWNAVEMLLGWFSETGFFCTSAPLLLTDFWACWKKKGTRARQGTARASVHGIIIRNNMWLSQRFSADKMHRTRELWILKSRCWSRHVRRGGLQQIYRSCSWGKRHTQIYLS